MRMIKKLFLERLGGCIFGNGFMYFPIKNYFSFRTFILNHRKMSKHGNDVPNSVDIIKLNHGKRCCRLAEISELQNNFDTSRDNIEFTKSMDSIFRAF